MRGGPGLDAAQAAVPDVLTPLVVALTHLGDPMVVLVLVAVVYWVGPRRGWLDRRAAARLLTVGFAALALTVLLKSEFGWQRPPATLHRVSTDGAGFPSGHATAATAVYAGLAVLLDRGPPRTRAAVAAAVVAVVAATRLVLGLHFAVDVLAGVVAGGAAVAATLWVTRRGVGRGFALAAAVGAGAAVVAWPSADAATALGGTVGAAVAWAALGERALGTETTPWPVLAGGGAMLAVATVTLLAASLPLVVEAVAAAGVGAGAVALPALRRSRGTSPSPTR